MDLGIAGKRALVLGASSGLGRASAAALVAEGAQVAIAARSVERIEAAGAEIGAAAAFAFDVGNVEEVPTFVAQVQERLNGPLDILVCNTGGPPAGADALGFPAAAWRDAHRDLVLAPVAFLEAVVPGMRERGWGRVVNIVSTAAREPLPDLVLSNSHRAAALATFKTVADQVAADGVTVNSVLPGPTRSRGVEDFVEALAAGEGKTFEAFETEFFEKVRPTSLIKRFATPEEVASLVAYVASPLASATTGAALRVEGGTVKSAF